MQQEGNEVVLGGLLVGSKMFFQVPISPGNNTSFVGVQPLKTHITLGNLHFQYEIHLQMLEFPLSCLFSGVKINLK